MPSRSANVLTVLNLKGGVGKTHTVWLLRAVAQERGVRMLAVDLDTQGNLSRSLLSGRAVGRNDAPDHGSEYGYVDRSRSDHDSTGSEGIEALFNPASEIDVRSLVRRTPFHSIDVIPASPLLARFDLSTQTAWEACDLHLCLVDAVAELRGDYDLIVFDCPPRLSLVSFAALCASDFIIIPLEAADWGAQGIVQVRAAVDYVKTCYNPSLALLGYLVSRFKRARQFQRSYLQKLREHFGIQAFDTAIPDLARFEQSVALNRPITLYAPASTEAGIARRLYAEVQRRISRSRRVSAPRGGRDVSVGNGAAA